MYPDFWFVWVITVCGIIIMGAPWRNRWMLHDCAGPAVTSQPVWHLESRPGEPMWGGPLYVVSLGNKMHWWYL